MGKNAKLITLIRFAFRTTYSSAKNLTLTGAVVVCFKCLPTCRGFRSAAISAVTAATKRSMQLGGIPEDEIRNKYNL